MPPPAAKPVLTRYLSYRLNTLTKLNDAVSQAQYHAGTGLSLAETRCLASVGAFSSLTLTQLAFEANLDKGSASRIAQSLVERGLISKQVSAQDARSVILSLTPQGHSLWQRCMEVIDRRSRELTRCLSDEEQRQLVDMFERMLEHAKAAAR